VLQKADFFGDEDLDLIYIAKKLREAKELERVLTTAGLDYLIETDTYVGGFIFRSARIGAFFYVRPADGPMARAAMEGGGFEPFEPEAAMEPPSGSQRES